MLPGFWFYAGVDLLIMMGAARDLLANRKPAMPPAQAQEALDDLLAAREKNQTQAAGWVGDAIYGINDGLGSIFGIVSGVSGATLGNSHFVLIAGLAGMVASALSMGSGAYLAAKSEREIFEAEFAREREAVEDNEARHVRSFPLATKSEVCRRKTRSDSSITWQRTRNNSSKHSRENASTRQRKG